MVQNPLPVSLSNYSVRNTHWFRFRLPAVFLPMVVSAFTLYHLRFSRLHLKFSMKQIYREIIFGSALLRMLYFAMVAPGAPQIQNAIPSSAVGEDLMAGMVVGFISCGVILVVGCFALMRMVAAQKAKGASFIAKPMDVFSDEDTKLPHPLIAFIPLIVTIILINVKINGQVICQLETGVLAGSVLALIMMWKYQDPSKLLGHVGDTCKSSLNAICNTSAVVAFGGVVKLAPAFAAVVNAMLNIPGPKILSLAIATTVLAGICGSASGGCGIASRC